MLDKMSDVSRIIERLRINEYVERVLCPNDRRAVDISITKKGLDLLKKIDKEEDNLELVLGNLSEAEAKKLSDLLDKIRDWSFFIETFSVKFFSLDENLFLVYIEFFCVIN